MIDTYPAPSTFNGLSACLGTCLPSNWCATPHPLPQYNKVNAAREMMNLIVWYIQQVWLACPLHHALFCFCLCFLFVCEWCEVGARAGVMRKMFMSAPSTHYIADWNPLIEIPWLKSPDWNPLIDIPRALCGTVGRKCKQHFLICLRGDLSIFKTVLVQHFNARSLIVDI